MTGFFNWPELSASGEHERIAELKAATNVRILNRTTGFGYFQQNMMALNERLTDHLSRPDIDMPRERLWQVQTPQAFYLGPLLEAHREAVMANYYATDDATLFEWMNWPVISVPGTPLSMKVTRAEDLALIEGWLSMREETTRQGRRRPRRTSAPRRGLAGA